MFLGKIKSVVRRGNMYSALDIANAFVSIFRHDEDGITNLKIQKLLYFAQGLSYQRYGKPLFNENIEAWKNGPVVNSVYAKYAGHKSSRIDDSTPPQLDPKAERIILDVAREYGKFTTNELINQTHYLDTPWANYYREGDAHTIIPKSAIKEYFQTKCDRIPNGDELVNVAIKQIPTIVIKNQEKSQ